MKDALRRYFADQRAAIARTCVERLSRLVAVPSVNAGRERLGEFPYLRVPGEESRVVAVLQDIFAELGLPCETPALVPERGNVLATLGTGRPTLLVGLHLDVVPPGDGWTTDPWTVVEQAGRLYGRGVLDNKGPAVATLAAMEALVRVGVPLRGSLQFAGIASEEFREPNEPDPGIAFLLQHGLLKPDFAIVPDIGERMRRIDIAEKGRVEIVVTAIGRQAHGSTPERGDNAVYRMAPFIERLKTLTLPHVPHPVLGGPTVNLGLIRGGAAANIVPGRCSVTLDVRFVPGQTADGILAAFRAVTAELGGDWEFAVRDAVAPHAVAADLPLVKVVQANAEPVLGFRPEPFGMGGGTFAKAFNLGGIPAVGFGPGDDEAFHVANEWVELDELVDFAEVLAGIAVDLLG